jgi:PAS domain S-box-containing protein
MVLSGWHRIPLKINNYNEMKKQKSKPEEAANLRQKAEEQMKLRKDKARLISTSATEPDLLKLIYELEVHQIELEMQNEELVIAKEKAELAEEKYTELYDFAPSGYIALSKVGEILELNFAAARMLGKERSKLIQKRFDFFVSVDTQTTFKLFLLDVFTSKVKQSCEVIISTDGNPAMAGQALPIYVNIDGIVSRNDEMVLLTLNDISERIRAKKELQGSEEKYRISEFDLKKAQQIAHLGNWMLHIENNELLWSDEIYRIFDCEPHEFKATYEAFLGFIHPDDREKVNAAYLKSLETKTDYQIEHRIITKNNQVKYVREKCLTTFNDQGKPLNSFGTVIDITEQKALENELIKAKEHAEESEARFRNLMESIDTVAVQGYGPDGITQFWNKASEKLYGYTQQEAIGKNLLDLIIPSEMKDGVTNAMHEMAQSGVPIPTEELLLKHKDGSPVPTLATVRLAQVHNFVLSVMAMPRVAVLPEVAATDTALLAQLPPTRPTTLPALMMVLPL